HIVTWIDIWRVARRLHGGGKRAWPCGYDLNGKGFAVEEWDPLKRAANRAIGRQDRYGRAAWPRIDAREIDTRRQCDREDNVLRIDQSGWSIVDHAGQH